MHNTYLQALQPMENGTAYVKMETPGPYPFLKSVKGYEIDIVNSEKIL